MKLKIFFLAFLFTCYLGSEVRAQTVDGIYYDWTVFEIDEPGKAKKCYIASFPKKQIGNHNKLREPYVLVTRYEGRKLEEISVYCGYEYKLNSKIYISIDGKQFRLFTKQIIAWAETSKDDKTIIQNLLKSKILKVRGESAMGSYSVDEYSLRGFTRAYKRMKDLCKSSEE